MINVTSRAYMNGIAMFWVQEELEDEEEEVWNGDVDSAEDESEEEEVPAQAFPQNVQQQH